MRYERSNDLGFAFGNVELTDGDVEVRSTEAIYFFDERRAVFDEPVELEDSTAVLRSERGVYLSPERRADFSENVTLDDPASWLEADSLSYFRDQRRSEAFGNVFIDRDPRSAANDPRQPDDATVDEDEQDTRTWLFGDEAINDEDEAYSDMRGAAFMVQVQVDSLGAPRDTLITDADRLVAQRSDSLHRLTATTDVRVWQDDLAATSDSLVYDRAISPDTVDTPSYEETRLFGDPDAWFERTQIHGDTLRTVVRDRTLDSLYVFSNAFAAQQDTVVQRIQQLRGRDMIAHFDDEVLRTIRAFPNAETIRFMEEDGQLAQAAEASADEIIVEFDAEGQLRDVRILSGVQSTLYDRHLIPEPFELDGFRWTPQARPRKEDLLEDPRFQNRLDQGWSFDQPHVPLVRRNPMPIDVDAAAENIE